MFESPPTVGRGGASVALLAAGAMEESARAELARLRNSRVPRLKTRVAAVAGGGKGRRAAISTD